MKNRRVKRYKVEVNLYIKLEDISEKNILQQFQKVNLGKSIYHSDKTIPETEITSEKSYKYEKQLRDGKQQLFLNAKKKP